MPVVVPRATRMFCLTLPLHITVPCECIAARTAHLTGAHTDASKSASPAPAPSTRRCARHFIASAISFARGGSAL